jgi:hypothetical protein
MSAGPIPAGEGVAMPMTLDGSCQCGAVRFSVESHTPVPYQRCYCSICRKSAAGGGYSINIGAVTDTLSVNDWDQLGLFHATREDGSHSEAERYFCTSCGSQLWLFDPRWPELVHPVASVIDTPLPVPPKLTHIFMADKPHWVTPEIGAWDEVFDAYPELSLADWHEANGCWVA